MRVVRSVVFAALPAGAAMAATAAMAQDFKAVPAPPQAFGAPPNAPAAWRTDFWLALLDRVAPVLRCHSYNHSLHGPRLWTWTAIHHSCIQQAARTPFALTNFARFIRRA